MKKLVAALLIVSVCVLLLASCGKTASPTPSTPLTSQTTTTRQTTTQPTTTQVTTTPAATQTTTTVRPSTTVPATTSTIPTTSTTVPSTTSTTSTPPKTSTTTATSTAPGHTTGGTLKWIEPVGPGTAIGWLGEAAGESLRSMQLCIETLLKGQVDGSLQPGLATSYDFVSDPANPSVTFHLRKGVKFHDGTDFNAQAVKWNFEQTKAGAANASTTMFWKSFDIIDDYTIRLNFTTWQNRFSMGLGMPATNMVSPTAFTKNGIDWMRVNMVGTGPFVQTSYQRDVILATKRNPDYWDTGKPYLDGVQLLYVADELTRVALFKSGGADVLNLNYNGMFANQLKDQGFIIESRLGGANMLIPDGVNADSPWSNLKVRQAAEYAIDKAALTNTFGYGYMQPAYQMPSAAASVYDPNFTGARTYNPDKAKQLLTEAGYPNGFKTNIIAVNTVDRNSIVAIQAYLAKVGIQASLQFVEIAQFQGYQQGTWKNGLLYATVFEYPNYNYNLNLYFAPTSAWYRSTHKPDGWKEALDASLLAPTADKALIQKLVRLLYDDASVITLNYPAYLAAMTSKVHDTGIYSRITNYYWNSQDAWLAK